MRGDPCIDCNRIAAGIQKRVHELLPVVPEVVEPWADNRPGPLPELESDTDHEETPMPPTPAAVPLPEAPASVNVRVTIGGREVQWTLRDTDEGRLAVRLEALLARYPLPQPPAQTPQPGPATVPAPATAPASETAPVLAALQGIHELLRDLLDVKETLSDLLDVKETLSDLLQVQVDSLRLLQSSHYERDSA